MLLLKRYLALFYKLLFCGLRREELLLLKVRDIDFERKILTVQDENSKIPSTRKIPLLSQTTMYLKDYLIAQKTYALLYLFVSPLRDGRLSYGGLTDVVKAL